MGSKKASKAAQREADQARADEAARQAEISRGTANINTMFDFGGKGGLLDTTAVYDPKGAYFLEDGSIWKPQTAAAAPPAAPAAPSGPQPGMPVGNNHATGTAPTGHHNPKGGNVRVGDSPTASLFGAPAGAATPGATATTGGAAAAPAAKSPEEQFQEMLASGKLYGASGGFNDAYYDGIAQSYLDWANPQLEKQHTDANRSLVYDLARGGKLDSSTRATKGAELQESYDLNQQQIADKALGVKNEAKGSVEDARAALISQLNATGDATGATNAAINRMSALSQPAGNYSTLANMFADFTGALGTNYAAERAYAASGGASAKGYTPVFGAKSNAVTVRA